MIKTSNKKLLSVLISSVLVLGITMPMISSNLSNSSSVAIAVDSKDDMKKLEQRLAQLKAERNTLQGVKDAFAKIGELSPKKKRLDDNTANLRKKLADFNDSYGYGEANPLKNKDHIVYRYYYETAHKEGNNPALLMKVTKFGKNITKADIINKQKAIQNCINLIKKEKPTSKTGIKYNKLILNSLNSYKNAMINTGNSLINQRAELEKVNIELKKDNNLVKGKNLNQVNSDIAKKDKEIKEIEKKLSELRNKKEDKKDDNDKKQDGGNNNNNPSVNNNDNSNNNIIIQQGIIELPRTGISNTIISLFSMLLLSGFGLRYLSRKRINR